MSYARITLFVLRTASEWAASTQILNTWEAGLETDTGKVKRGNGIDLYSALSYLTWGSGGGGGGGDMLGANNLSDVVSASASRGNLGATTVGSNIFTIADPSAIRFIRINADNSVTLLDASTFLAAIGGQASGSYITTETDPIFLSWLSGPPNISTFTNDAGYITANPPSTFDFTDQTGLITNTLIFSNTITLSGSSSAIWLFAVRGASGNPKLSINGGTFVTEGIARTGDTIQLSMTSDGSNSTARTCNLYTLGLSIDWSITTAAFLPTDITGCKLWLDSGAGVTKDGSDLVSLWADQSGNSNNAAQATGTNQPLWVNSVLNSKPVMRFDGVDNFLRIANSVTVGTAFVVSKYDLSTFSGYSGILGAASGSSEPSYILTGTSGTTSFFDNAVYCLFPSKIYNDEILTDDYSPMTSFKITYGLANATYWSPTAYTNMDVGRNQINNNYWDGDIAEVLIYNTVLSAPDIASVIAYLDAKYAL